MGKKIVTLTGHKHTKKTLVAFRLSNNGDVEYVTPYTDKEIPKWIDSEEVDSYHHVLPQVLDRMIDEEEVLTMKTVGDDRYVVFKFQCFAPYSVIIVDDYGVMDIKSAWDGELFTVRLVSDNEIESDRVGEYMFKHEFDLVFDYEKDSFDKLESAVS